MTHGGRTDHEGGMRPKWLLRCSRWRLACAVALLTLLTTAGAASALTIVQPLPVLEGLYPETGAARTASFELGLGEGLNQVALVVEGYVACNGCAPAFFHLLSDESGALEGSFAFSIDLGRTSALPAAQTVPLSFSLALGSVIGFDTASCSVLFCFVTPIIGPSSPAVVTKAWMQVDNQPLAAPEPGLCLLLGLGACALGARCRPRSGG